VKRYDPGEQGRSRNLLRADCEQTWKLFFMTTMTHTLSSEQQEILLRGLRFVKNSVALEMIDYTPQVEAERKRQYAAIAELEALINGRAVAVPAR